MIVYYSADDQELHKFETATDGWCIGREREQRALVELCAEHFVDCHYGWKYSWPLEFSLHDESKSLIAKFKVEREMLLDYTAVAII